ncbi:DMT family transporter [Planktotalea sp.]|uniref:DMT family transporter n=1 Tax=Planktotalea sp. TaxID=2029877 RepID=UPI003D6A21D5
MKTNKDISPLAWGLLALLALAWGGSFLSIRIALDEVGFLTSVAHRVGWAMCLLWGYVWLKGLPFPKESRIWIGFLGMGLLNNVIPFSLMAWGQLTIESGLTSILNAATAIFGVLLAAVFFVDERLTLRKAIGVGLGFLGVATAIGIQHLLAFNLQSLAQIAVIGGTISYALASIWARKRLAGLAPEVAAAGMLTGSTIIMLPAAWIIEGPMTLALKPITWAAIGYYVIIATALAYLLYYKILDLAGSGNLMLVTLLVPPVAIVLGAIFLGEALHPRAYVGFGLLALGLIILDGRAVDALRRGK